MSAPAPGTYQFKAGGRHVLDQKERESLAVAGSGADVPRAFTKEEVGVLERTIGLLGDAINRVRATTNRVEQRADAFLGSLGEGEDGAAEPRGTKAGQAKEVEGLAHELHAALNELDRQVDRLGEL